MRVVFDTNTLVGAALQVGSVPHKALGLALAIGQLCACAQTLTELQKVLRRPKFDRYQSLGVRREYFDIVAAASVVYDVSADDLAAVEPRCRNPKDDMFLALASACQANLIVTSDADLLVLDPWQAVRVLKPGAFLELHG